ncbi:MAG: hypothetical protein AB8G11_23620 [Saprospiraceae bacterium]
MNIRNYLLLLILLLSFDSINAQYTIADTYAMEKALAANDTNQVLKLVLQHTPPISNVKRLRSTLDKNPYIKRYLKDYDFTDDQLKSVQTKVKKDREVRWQFKTEEERYRQVRQTSGQRANNYSRTQRYSSTGQYNQLVSTATSVNYNRGFSTQSNIVAGLTDFIIERAQEEVANAFLQTFKRKMNDEDDYAQLQQLFPTTKEFLGDNELTTSTPIIQMARGSFEDDITQLSVNVPKLLRLSEFKDAQHSENIVVMTLLYEVLDMVYKGLEPDDIVMISEDRLQWQIWKLEQDNKKNYISALKTKGAEQKQLVDKVKSLNKKSKNYKKEIKTLIAFQKAYEQLLGDGRFNPYEDLDLVFIDGSAFLEYGSSSKNVYNTINDMEKSLVVVEEDIRNARQLELFKSGNIKLLEEAEKALKKMQKWDEFNDMIEVHDKFQIAHTENIIGKNVANLRRIVNALNYSSFILYSFIDKSSDSHFATRERLDSLFNDAERKQIFLGLLHQKFSNKIAIKNLDVYVDRYYILLEDLQLQKRHIQNTRKTAANRYQVSEAYLPAVKTTYDLLTTGLNVEVEGDSTLLTQSEVKNLENVAEQTYNLSRNTYYREYNDAVFNASTLMDYMLEEQKDQKPYQKLKKDFLQYGLFIANVLQARSPAEVKAAIRMVALPPGSSQAKKQSTFDISVNSYFGVYGGREILIDPDVVDPINPTYGLTLPIGISISTGLRRYGSISIFTPIFDLGSVAAFRIETGQAVNLPAFNIQNLASPGAYLIYGFPNYPFSIGGGVQYGPQLRKVSRNGVDVESAAYRYSIALTVDIPLINLYNRP